MSTHKMNFIPTDTKIAFLDKNKIKLKKIDQS